MLNAAIPYVLIHHRKQAPQAVGEVRYNSLRQARKTEAILAARLFSLFLAGAYGETRDSPMRPGAASNGDPGPWREWTAYRVGIAWWPRQGRDWLHPINSRSAGPATGLEKRRPRPRIGG